MFITLADSKERVLAGGEVANTSLLEEATEDCPAVAHLYSLEVHLWAARP